MQSTQFQYKLASCMLLAICAVFLVTITAQSSWAHEPEQLRVIWKESPATTAIVSWSTTSRGAKHVVHYDTQSRKGKSDQYSAKVDQHTTGPYDNNPKAEKAEKYYHHLKLENLKPSTTYYFVVESDDHVSKEHYFVTAPTDDREFSVLFGGDSRSDAKTRVRINKMIAQMVADDPQIMALVHGGDYIVSGKSWSQWNLWMTNHTATITPSGRVLPIIAARGNHDKGDMFNQVFASPGQGENTNYYTTQLGAKVALVTLKTETSTAGTQKQWLDKQLKELRPKNRWLLTQYHRPAWPAVKRPSSAKKDWVPLFEKYNVDLACEADGHNIKRTPPIRNEKQDETGVTYIGEGGMGVGQRKPDMSRWYLKTPGIAHHAHHMMKLTFTAKGLHYQTILLKDQEVYDKLTLKPRK